MPGSFFVRAEEQIFQIGSSCSLPIASNSPALAKRGRGTGTEDKGARGSPSFSMNPPPVE